MELDGQVAVVTGAGRGIGRVIALELARQGADVVLAARSVDLLEKTAGDVRALGRRALVVPTDVAVEAEVQQMAAAVAEFGGVDVLVANSGVGGPSAPLWEVTPDDWDATMAVNVRGVYLCCRALLPHMIDRGGGSVVVIGSYTGKRPLLNRTPYTTSKMALVGLVRTLAVEAGPHGVRANLVSPGGVEGDRIDWVIRKQMDSRGISYEEARALFTADSPMQRLVQPEEVAHAVAYLASARSSGTTGEDLNVSAGAVMY